MQEVICAYCKAKIIKPSHGNRVNKYCSKACADAARVGKPHPTIKKSLVDKVCPVCNNVFSVKPSQAERRVCCSRQCTNTLRKSLALGYDPNRRVKKQCPVCKHDFWVKKSRIGRQDTYCSVECMAEEFKTKLKGKRNPNYKHGMVKIRERRERETEGSYTQADINYLMRVQSGLCVYCGKSIKSKYHVDHRIPLSRGGRSFVGNLQLLCPSCNLRKWARMHYEYLVILRTGQRRRPRGQL